MRASGKVLGLDSRQLVRCPDDDLRRVETMNKMKNKADKHKAPVKKMADWRACKNIKKCKPNKALYNHLDNIKLFD